MSYKSQSGLKRTGQAYCAYCSRETLITNGSRHLISLEEHIFRHIINMQKGTKFVCRTTLAHINKGKAYGRQGKVPNRSKITLYHYYHYYDSFFLLKFLNYGKVVNFSKSSLLFPNLLLSKTAYYSFKWPIPWPWILYLKHLKTYLPVVRRISFFTDCFKRSNLL